MRVGAARFRLLPRLRKDRRPLCLQAPEEPGLEPEPGPLLDLEQMQEVHVHKLASILIAIATRTATVQQVLRVPKDSQEPLERPATGEIVDNKEAEETIRKCEWASSRDVSSARLALLDHQVHQAPTVWLGCKGCLEWEACLECLEPLAIADRKVHLDPLEPLAKRERREHLVLMEPQEEANQAPRDQLVLQVPKDHRAPPARALVQVHPDPVDLLDRLEILERLESMVLKALQVLKVNMDQTLNTVLALVAVFSVAHK